MNNINDIKFSQLCYGCGTCNVICSHLAITMRYDNIGRLLPVIDEEKCTDCGLCRTNCPSLDLKGIQLPNTDDRYVGHIEKVYIGKAKDERIYKNSQSGGLVTATIKYLFETGKIDAAIMCRVEESVEYTSKAVVITNPDELYLCQKSSYVPVDIVSALKHINQYKYIAVVGTGCHIQGIRALKNFNKKYGGKIKYTLGLICDRTLCKTATDVLYGSHFKKESKKLIWRDKSKNYKTAQLLIKTTKNQIKIIPSWRRHVLKDPFTNPRCRICFDKLNTHADIVYGDPWGMNNVDWQSGMSVLLIRTAIGEDVINNMIQSNLVSLNTAPLSEVISGQRIEKRRNEVSMALGFYRKNGWLLPVYAEKHLKINDVSPEISYKIRSFINDSNLPKREIVRKYRFYIKKEALNKNKIFILLKKGAKLPFRLMK